MGDCGCLIDMAVFSKCLANDDGCLVVDDGCLMGDDGWLVDRVKGGR